MVYPDGAMFVRIAEQHFSSIRRRTETKRFLEVCRIDRRQVPTQRDTLFHCRVTERSNYRRLIDSRTRNPSVINIRPWISHSNLLRQLLEARLNGAGVVSASQMSPKKRPPQSPSLIVR